MIQSHGSSRYGRSASGNAEEFSVIVDIRDTEHRNLQTTCNKAESGWTEKSTEFSTRPATVVIHTLHRWWIRMIREKVSGVVEAHWFERLPAWIIDHTLLSEIRNHLWGSPSFKYRSRFLLLNYVFSHNIIVCFFFLFLLIFLQFPSLNDFVTWISFPFSLKFLLIWCFLPPWWFCGCFIKCSPDDRILRRRDSILN